MKLDDRIKKLETIVEGDLTEDMSRRALKESVNILKDLVTVLKLCRDLIDSNHKMILKTQILVMLETKEDRVLEEMKQLIEQKWPEPDH